MIVITDRHVLDQQLQDAIYQIEHAQGVVKAIDQDSKQLAAALIDGTKIVITTLQKFPFVLRGLLHDGRRGKPGAGDRRERRAGQGMGGRHRRAQVCDHRGRGPLQPDRRNGAGTESDPWRGSDPAADGEEEEADWEDRLNQVMQSRGRQPNLSFFAFTATPKGKTLELFGRAGASGKPEAFHIYSMRQAIEEGFILDVLHQLHHLRHLLPAGQGGGGRPRAAEEKGGAGAGQVHEPAPAQHRAEDRGDGRALPRARAATSSAAGPRRWWSRPRACMRCATSWRSSATSRSTATPTSARWWPSAARCRDPETGLEYTEPGMNPDCVTGKPISESQLPERFDSPDYHVLLVANKYQTGFDQPLLHTMYVDKTARWRAGGADAVAPEPHDSGQGRARSSWTSSTTPRTSTAPSNPITTRPSLQEASDPAQLEH